MLIALGSAGEIAEVFIGPPHLEHGVGPGTLAIAIHLKTKHRLVRFLIEIDVAQQPMGQEPGVFLFVAGEFLRLVLADILKDGDRLVDLPLEPPQSALNQLGLNACPARPRARSAR